MENLVSYIVKGLVAHPDQVHIREVAGDKTQAYEIQVSPQDRGVLIGKQGRTIRSVRSLISAAASRSGKRAIVEVLD